MGQLLPQQLPGGVMQIIGVLVPNQSTQFSENMSQSPLLFQIFPGDNIQNPRLML